MQTEHKAKKNLMEADGGGSWNIVDSSHDKPLFSWWCLPIVRIIYILLLVSLWNLTEYPGYKC